MDLKAYMKQKGKNAASGQEPVNKAGGQEIPPEQRAAAEDIMAQARQYDGMGENQLMGELMKNIAKGREDGSFSQEKLNDFIAKVSPMLTPDQAKKLEEIKGKLR